MDPVQCIGIPDLSAGKDLPKNVIDVTFCACRHEKGIHEGQDITFLDLVDQVRVCIHILHRDGLHRLFISVPGCLQQLPAAVGTSVDKLYVLRGFFQRKDDCPLHGKSGQADAGTRVRQFLESAEKQVIDRVQQPKDQGRPDPHVVTDSGKGAVIDPVFNEDLLHGRDHIRQQIRLYFP